MKHPASWWPNWLCLISQLELTPVALGARPQQGWDTDFQGFGFWAYLIPCLYPILQAPAASVPAPVSLVETAAEDSSPRGTLASSGDGEEP
jgi:hypothetical protein